MFVSTTVGPVTIWKAPHERQHDLVREPVAALELEVAELGGGERARDVRVGVDVAHAAGPPDAAAEERADLNV